MEGKIIYSLLQLIVIRVWCYSIFSMPYISCVCVCVSLITCAALWDGAIFYCSMQEKKFVNVVNVFFFLIIEKKINCKLKS